MSEVDETIENLRKNKGVSFTEADIILNLIEKQKEEIEEWQKAYINNDNYWDKFRDKINKIANNNKDCSDNAVIKAVKNLKEKNASLQKEIKLMKSINLNNNYINKKKIRAKINWLESQFDEGIESEQNQFIIDCVAILEELLEE